MLASMSSRELQEWIAYDRLEPLSESWRQTGLLAAILFNGLFAGSRKTADDFIPAVRAPKPLQSAEEGIANMAMIAANFRNQGG